MGALARVQVSANLFSTGSDQSVSNTVYFAPGAFSLNSSVDAALTTPQINEVVARIPVAWGTLSGVLSQNAVNPTTITVYDMFDPMPRVPKSVSTFSLTRGAGSAHPTEVAMVLSYQTVFESGTSRARRRGRLYLGPILAGSGVGGTGTTPSRPGTTWTTALTAFCNAMQATIAQPMTWVQYSPTDGVYGTVNIATYDDAWDTMRSRGAPPTARVTVAAP